MIQVVEEMMNRGLMNSSKFLSEELYYRSESDVAASTLEIKSARYLHGKALFDCREYIRYLLGMGLISGLYPLVSSQVKLEAGSPQV